MSTDEVHQHRIRAAAAHTSLRSALEVRIRTDPRDLEALHDLGRIHLYAAEYPTALALSLQCLRGVFSLPSHRGDAQVFHAAREYGTTVDADGGVGFAASEVALCAQAMVDPTSHAWPAGSEKVVQLNIRALPAYSNERVWTAQVGPKTLRIMSVVRFSDCAQYGDIVVAEPAGGAKFLLTTMSPRERREAITEAASDGHTFLAVATTAGYLCYTARGLSTSPTDAMALTEALRKEGLHFEAWSMTMRLPPPKKAAGGAARKEPDETQPAPLEGGIVAHKDKLMEAWDKLRAARTAEGKALYSPELAEAAGDQVGALRERRALKAGKS